ncbi:hypothetical protein b3_0227 [Synechococcus phage B3]|nr:hypothetical protein b3_0227 [Synechococcus phage B3]
MNKKVFIIIQIVTLIINLIVLSLQIYNLNVQNRTLENLKQKQTQKITHHVFY